MLIDSQRIEKYYSDLDKIYASYRVEKEHEDSIKNHKLNEVFFERYVGIGQLAAGVAHEIDNPLGFVPSNFETLREYAEKRSEILVAYKVFYQTVKKSFPFEPDKEIRCNLH